MEGPFHGQKLLVRLLRPHYPQWRGFTRPFPRWRERSRCTFAHETPPLGGTVQNFAQQFLAVQQQTEAIHHILPRRDAPTTAAQALVCPAPWVSRKSTKRPWRGQPGDVGVCSFSGDSENNAAPSPGGGPGRESYVSFCFCSAVPSFSKKEQWLGTWHPQLQSRRSGCFIWDHFSTGYTPKSRGGHGCLWHNRCLQHGLGCYMQRAGSLVALDRAPTTLAHQLPRAVGSASSLRQFRPLLLGKHVLVRTDNTAAVSYINRLGGIRSRRMSQLARHLLLWSHMQFKSMRAVHIPGKLNRAADALSRQLTFPGEWRLHHGWSGVDSGKLRWTCSLPMSPPIASHKYAFPPVSLLTQTLCKLREDEEQPAGCTALAHPDLVSRTHFPRDSTSLAHSSEEGPPFWCTIGVVLSFLQERLERRLSPYESVCGPPRCSGRPVPGKTWFHREVPEGWIPPGHPLCPLGTSLSPWLDFRGAPLSAGLSRAEIPVY